jgi:nucleoside-diphosphate-sugar epimerase
MKKNILVVGSAGYIGTVVVKYFLKKNYDVYGIDNFTYGKSKNILINHKNFYFYNLSINKYDFIKKLLKDKKIKNVVILSGLVGDPITKKYPKISKLSNENYIIRLIDNCYSSIHLQRLIFVSTCSNYGIAKNLPDEKSKLKPLSLYAKSKVKIEKYLLSKRNKKISYCILRFATAFGLSDRMRFDLTLNEFVLNIFQKKELEVYDKNTWRPYCHVKDFANAIFHVVNSPKIKIHNEIYNVGLNKNNATKEMLIQKISKFLDTKKIKYVNNSFDKRNYRVNFDKLKKKLKFNVKYNINDGVKEIINFLKKNKNINSKKMGNYKVIND